MASNLARMQAQWFEPEWIGDDPTDSPLFRDLNPVQREAVAATDGPVVVVAGAGSGKTRVLTYRIAHLIRDLKVPPASVMAITFTNKAANEMRERVAHLVGGAVKQMWVSTFHSACVRILRRDASRFGYRSGFSIYDEADSIRLITQCVKDLDLDTKRFPPRNLKAAISNAKNELIDFESFARTDSGFYHEQVADVYRLYQQRLLEASAMDFDDLLMVTVELFGAFPDVLEHYQNRFRYVMVDEYQDTNKAQYMLVKMLTDSHRNICVVGDSDQSIYRWRGADVRNILDFEQDYPDARVIVLEQNYRSTSNILDAANALIANNPRRQSKHLWSDKGPGDRIVRFEGEDEHDEAGYIVDQVEKLFDEGYNPSDIAVFYRTNAQSRVIEDVFVRRGLAYTVIGSVRFYERREIKDVIAYLRSVVNPDDQVALKRIINEPKRGIGDTTIAHVDRFAQRHQITFFEALGRAEEIDALNSGAVRRIAEFLAVMELIRDRAEHGSVEAVVVSAIEDSGYAQYLESERTIEALGRLENLRELQSVASEFEEANEGAIIDDRPFDDMDTFQRLEVFLEQTALVNDVDALDDGAGAVTLMTLHTAKGLEYPVVFLVGMEDGVFPHMRALGEPVELEEERRLAYVGITRAEQKLYLTSAWSRTLWGATNYNPPSRFLKEVPSELVEAAEKRDRFARADAKTGPAHTVSSNEISAGDRVRHDKWGLGTVHEVVGGGDRAEAVVIFDGEGRKRLLLAWAPLELVG
jgi:DNA helicase-2/ATP-dependent DNA helicase PcrA